MKLQKQISRKTKNKVYSKWSITLPSELIAELGWNVGDDIDAKFEEGNIILSRKSNKKTKRIKEIASKKELSFFERFALVYSNLPLQERKMPVVVIDSEPITWEMVHREIRGKTGLGKIVGKRLIRLGII